VAADKQRVLVVNPGSTSTKVAVFEGDVLLKESFLPVGPDRAAEIWDELGVRLDGVRDWLAEEAIPLESMDAVVGRGGLLRPLTGGVYEVTEAMLTDARANRQGVHASNLGCALAHALAEAGTGEKREPGGGGGGGGASSIPAFVVDPVSTDEFDPIARVSGLREIPRRSLSHALSIHALVREVCRRANRPVPGSSFVVAHLGGGISICLVRDGLIVDASNANSGGPFSPTRAGGLPAQELLDLAFSESYEEGRLRAMTLREGGLRSYLGTDDAREVEARVDAGDEEATLVFRAMAYQIAKEIGAMATVLEGRLDGILITGGLAGSDLLMKWIRDRVEFIAPVDVVPEVEEMRALAQGALRVLRGEEEAKAY
jgi:butyrate kinase